MSLDICFDVKTFLERTCRTCSRYFGDYEGEMRFHAFFTEPAVQVDDKTEQKPLPLSEDIREIYGELVIWNLNISLGDGMPQQICHDCFGRLYMVKNFREECLDTQKVLESYFKDFDTLLEAGSFGKLSPKSESVKSELGASPAPSSFNADDLVEEVPESPERQQLTAAKLRQSPKSHEAVYAESSLGTPPPLFEEMKTEAIDMETMEYLKTEAELQLDVMPKIEIKEEEENEVDNSEARRFITVRKTPSPSPAAVLPLHFSSSDDESSTPTSDEEDNHISSSETESESEYDFECRKKSMYNNTRKPLQCKICSSSFPKRSMLKEHHIRFHPQEKPYICVICSSAFKTHFLLSQHKLKHNRLDSIKCSLCAKYFRSQLHLQRHTKNFHLTSTYTCHICNEKFENYTQVRFQYHLRQHEEKRFQCGYCDKSFHQKIHLINHERTHTKEHPFRCNICGKSYRQQIACQEHMLKHNDPTPFKCNLCQKGFSQRSSLRLHYRIHQDDKPFSCNLCRQKFAQKVHYEMHTLTHAKHANSRDSELRKANKKLHVCPHCNVIFKKLTYLNAHIRSVHLKRRSAYTCGYCSKAFTLETSLKTHMSIQHAPKPLLDSFKCQYCDKSFEVKHLLLIHEEQHKQVESQKQYKCNFCNESFLRRSALGKHILSHLDCDSINNYDLLESTVDATI